MESSNNSTILQKKRRPNFNEDELLALINAVNSNRNVLLGKFDKNVTAKAKTLAWHKI